jgi:hypothetical protein
MGEVVLAGKKCLRLAAGTTDKAEEQRRARSAAWAIILMFIRESASTTIKLIAGKLLAASSSLFPLVR